MRILVDTNILISAILFPKSLVAKALLYITDNHSIVFCDQNISELREVLRRKKPDKLPDAEVLLAELSYELIPASYHAEKLIRDAKDQPILNAAIIADVDVILTGDKDFLSLDMEHPRCMSVAQFLEMESVEL
ncbi:putative toxin-antitoxin system toxin component, PIN family [Oscillospiraceae bacterium Marseille-Q3528]|nr:putative toxin-antitoxin system toxin component, PIN family [Oscillospiraceae bacterium Marseille-Q3528]